MAEEVQLRSSKHLRIIYAGPIRTSFVIGFNGSLPKISYAGFAVVAKADIYQIITERVIGLEVRRRLGCSPLFNDTSEVCGPIPTTKLATPFGLVIKGGAKGYNAFNLPDGC